MLQYWNWTVKLKNTQAGIGRSQWHLAPSLLFSLGQWKSREEAAFMMKQQEREENKGEREHENTTMKNTESLLWILKLGKTITNFLHLKSDKTYSRVIKLLFSLIHMKLNLNLFELTLDWSGRVPFRADLLLKIRHL